ncbi:uncharacterized protein E0L32_011294 [Thyridium curvatum]|uniref:DUF7703 domain-containing protein n=1 Tax=Thyridium curvatum TaxID=1093900 RepID=A0A507BQF7_9PEZI|nr:uncharacterized protein E0L32_011294 [Thyridium curvatum]TPX19050.1 hypothetical protein E0L32_011294 [Thyridium curvatum]
MNPNVALPATTFLGIALYNVLELTCLIFLSGRHPGRWRSHHPGPHSSPSSSSWQWQQQHHRARGRHARLFFWSFLIATWAIVPYAVGILIKGLQLVPPDRNAAFAAPVLLGWGPMITAQALVLYSRLHLVDRSRLRLRAVLLMIIAVATVCHVPLAVLFVGATSANPARWVEPYVLAEKTQVVIVFVQELVLSGLYVFHSARLLRSPDNVSACVGRRRDEVAALRRLVLVNVVIIVLDVGILVPEYAGRFDLHAACKALVYSIKLKVEYDILNRLTDLRGLSASAAMPYPGVPEAGNMVSVDGQPMQMAEHHLHHQHFHHRWQTTTDQQPLSFEIYDGSQDVKFRGDGSVLSQSRGELPSNFTTCNAFAQGGRLTRVSSVGVTPDSGIMVRTTTDVQSVHQSIRTDVE